jgi:hypothetical protein
LYHAEKKQDKFMKPDKLNILSPHTKIFYKLQARSHVTLTVLDALGRLIAILVDEVEERGDKLVNFNANGLGSGEYWYRLSVRAGGQNGKSKSYTKRKKLFLL